MRRSEIIPKDTNLTDRPDLFPAWNSLFEVQKKLYARHQLELIDEYGGMDAIGEDHTAPHYAAAWAHAGGP